MVASKIHIQIPAVRIEYDKKFIRASLRQAGQEIAKEARALTKSSGSGRLYYGGGGNRFDGRPYKPGRYRASTPGSAPAKVTGMLSRSIRVKEFRSKGDGVRIIDSRFYALFLEVGAKGGRPARRKGGRRYQAAKSRVLEPRPFLTKALENQKPKITPLIGEAVMRGIDLKTLVRSQR